MRLLDAEKLVRDGQTELVEFLDERSLPPYAILSHTWTTEEILYDDLKVVAKHGTSSIPALDDISAEVCPSFSETRDGTSSNASARPNYGRHV